MSAQKDINTGKWYIQYRYTDWTGKRKHSVKRGFNTKREAEDWHVQLSVKVKISIRELLQKSSGLLKIWLRIRCVQQRKHHSPGTAGDRKKAYGNEQYC